MATTLTIAVPSVDTTVFTPLMTILSGTATHNATGTITSVTCTLAGGGTPTSATASGTATWSFAAGTFTLPPNAASTFRIKATQAGSTGGATRVITYTVLPGTSTQSMSIRAPQMHRGAVRGAGGR